MAVANVTLNHQLGATPPAAIEGQYTNVFCYQANAQNVATAMSETCQVAAANFDPKAQA